VLVVVVIPAPRVYTKAVAVKTLVVELLHPVISLVSGSGQAGFWRFMPEPVGLAGGHFKRSRLGGYLFHSLCG